MAVCLAALLLPALTIALNTQIDEGASFCVSKQMEKLDKGHLTWHVYAGGLLDANFKVVFFTESPLLPYYSKNNAIWEIYIPTIHFLLIFICFYSFSSFSTLFSCFLLLFTHSFQFCRFLHAHLLHLIVKRITPSGKKYPKQSLFC
jgi:hypothetical protein